MNLLLVRHAQSANNLLYAQTGSSEGRHADPSLTELGFAQAQALADFARTDATWQGVTHLYCSLARRAVQTAAPLAQALGLPAQGLAQAYEAGGLFERQEDRTPYAVPGLSHAELLADNPALLWPADLPAAEPWAGGFEAYEEPGVLEARAAQVVEVLRAAHGEADTVALVTHGHFTQFLLRQFIAHGNAYFRVVNTATTLLTLPGPDAPEGWGPLVDWVNRFDHLRPEQVSQ
ncbi:histidine phosphatase family protein [Deinococcus sp. Marseille-Q6407]|uniref:histidine phosphatase family protein n=1 Tax=Deinococcus sp. Marseille-Q6407 TaxID=2969223 RepID=UPI0021BE0F16|nr:histidine phosphatase family protein [Deinococcus sp. Marseille-Q6407]